MKTASQPIAADAPDAVILDLEGVVTQTTLLHARAWQTTFDTFFRGRPDGPALGRLDARKDYLPLFDGKPCLEGIRGFLASRGMRLPEGSTHAAPGTETLHGLGNLKHKILLRLVEEEGVDVFTDAVARIRHWRAGGKKIAVILPGKCGAAIIRRAGLDHLFDVLVDATAPSRPGGLPAADVLGRAARELGVPPGRTMVIEPTGPGRPARNADGFGLVVGVARHVQGEERTPYRAGVVVQSLAELEPPVEPSHQPTERANA